MKKERWKKGRWELERESSVVVRTLKSPDGVLGLNGFWYLEDDDGNPMKFDSINEAKQFIKSGGENPDDEFIEYLNCNAKIQLLKRRKEVIKTMVKWKLRKKKEIKGDKDRDNVKNALIESRIKLAAEEENIMRESYWYDILMYGCIGYDNYSDRDLLYEYNYVFNTDDTLENIDDEIDLDKEME